MRIILNDLKVTCEEPIILYGDNKWAISISHNPVQHDKTKHIEIDRHFIKEKLDSGLITTFYVPSRLQLADLFTKGLSTNFMISHASWDRTIENQIWRNEPRIKPEN